jgi:hypothetical protein
MYARRTAATYPPADDAVAGLRRRLIERAQAEIDVARATGDHHRAELLALRAHDYPAYLAAMARESAAAVAGLPLCERLTG